MNTDEHGAAEPQSKVAGCGAGNQPAPQCDAPEAALQIVAAREEFKT